ATLSAFHHSPNFRRRLMKSGSLAFALTLLLTALGAVAGNLPAVDTSFKPGDDFYKYVNGAWLKATEIPADRSSISDGAVLSELSDKRTREIIQQTASDKSATADAKKIADFYNASMDDGKTRSLGSSRSRRSSRKSRQSATARLCLAC